MKWNPSFHDDYCLNILLFKCSLSEKWVWKHTALGFPFIRGHPPIYEMKSILTEWLMSKYSTVKISLSEKWVWKHTALGFPFIKGHPPIYEMKSILKQWLMPKYSAVKNLAFWKVGMQAYNFGVAVYKVVIPPQMKWNPSLHNDYCLTKLLYGHLTFLKVIWESKNFRVSVYKGVLLTWMKCNPSSLLEQNDFTFTRWLMYEKLPA